MRRVLPESEAHFWEHYPEDDARDAFTRSRWYYHIHAPGERDADEHGHFHLFLHRGQMDARAATIAQPVDGEEAQASVTHIAGLSIDHQGVPISWFVTNRWVTDEFMYPAATMIAHLDRYNVDHTPEDAFVNRFLTAMVALYRDEIAELLEERDARLTEMGAGSDRPELYEAGSAILSSRRIDLDRKIARL